MTAERDRTTCRGCGHSLHFDICVGVNTAPCGCTDIPIPPPIAERDRLAALLHESMDVMVKVRPSRRYLGDDIGTLIAGGFEEGYLALADRLIAAGVGLPDTSEHALHFDPDCEECAYLARPTRATLDLDVERLARALRRVRFEAWGSFADAPPDFIQQAAAAIAVAYREDADAAPRG